MFIAAATLLLLWLGLLAQGQEPYICDVSPCVEIHCREDNNLNWNDLETMRNASTGCHDAFEESYRGRCYHECILRKMGVWDEDLVIDMDLAVEKWHFASSRYLSHSIRMCDDYALTKPCERSYHLHKCLSSTMNDYPHGTRVVKLKGPEHIEANAECLAEVGLTRDEWCMAMNNMEEDAFELDRRGRCYFRCLMERSGVACPFNDYKALRAMFDYVDTNALLETLHKCTKNQIDDPCDYAYQLVKCIRYDLGEYPVMNW